MVGLCSQVQDIAQEHTGKALCQMESEPRNKNNTSKAEATANWNTQSISGEHNPMNTTDSEHDEHIMDKN
jgi:hypothetical protein